MRSSLGLFALFFLVAAEIIAYGLVIQHFGIAIAVLIGIGSLALGFAAFRRLGLKLASIGPANFSNGEAIWKTVKGIGWAALGALLLVLPGFLSNLAGLIMLVLNFKAWLFPGHHIAEAPDRVVELDRGEWHSEASNDVNNRNVGPTISHKPDQRP